MRHGTSIGGARPNALIQANDRKYVAKFSPSNDYALTPAYDICPQARTGNVASQGMLIMGQANQSQIALCLDAAHLFLLDRHAARAIVLAQLESVRRHWAVVCDEARISIVDRNVLATRQMLNPFVFEQLGEADLDIAQMADEIRPTLVAW